MSALLLMPALLLVSIFLFFREDHLDRRRELLSRLKENQNSFRVCRDELEAIVNANNLTQSESLTKISYVAYLNYLKTEFPENRFELFERQLKCWNSSENVMRECKQLLHRMIDETVVLKMEVFIIGDKIDR